MLVTLSTEARQQSLNLCRTEIARAIEFRIPRRDGGLQDAVECDMALQKAFDTSLRADATPFLREQIVPPSDPIFRQHLCFQIVFLRPDSPKSITGERSRIVEDFGHMPLQTTNRTPRCISQGARRRIRGLLGLKMGQTTRKIAVVQR